MLFLALKMYVHGYYCDICIKLCEKIAEAQLKKGRQLNKKLLTKLSNLTSKNLETWQETEKRFIRLSVKR